ncbi:MAG: hypothetical protein R2811_05670 [Flavobacteriales bacterium]
MMDQNVPKVSSAIKLTFNAEQVYQLQVIELTCMCPELFHGDSQMGSKRSRTRGW